MNQSPQSNEMQAAVHAGAAAAPAAARRPWPERLILWIVSASAAAFAISIVAHILMWVLSAFILIGGVPQRGSGEGGGDMVEMALISESDLSDMMGSELDLEAPSVPDVEVRAPEVADLMDSAPGDSAVAAGGLSDLGDVGVGGDIGESGGEGMGGGGSGKGASFFGVEAQGNRFAYIVDVSGSMQGDRLAGLKSELTRSIGDLLDTSEFLVVPFSSESAPLGGRSEWSDASQNNKKWARSQIELLQANGGTVPLPGFQIIFGARPRPDAIYFMTDGEFDRETVEEVARLNSRLRIPIHCICFGSNDGEALLRQIARQSKGTYTFIAGP